MAKSCSHSQPRKWYGFFGILFEHLTGRQADTVTQSRFHTLSYCIEHGELHEESMALMTFTLALQRVFCAAGVTDFSVRDLIDPKPTRLVRIMSGAINFIRFRDVRTEVFDKKKEELERRRYIYDHVLKENAELKKTLAAKREDHGVQMVTMKQLQEQNDVISTRLQELHKQREVIQKGLAEAKKELSERNAANDQLRVNILTAQAEGDKLSQRIVQSPERVKVEQEQAKNRILALRCEVAENQTRLLELQRREKDTTDKQQNAEKAVRLLRDITNDKLLEVEKEIACLRDSRHDMHTKQQSLMSKQENQKQVLTSRQDKLSKQDLKYHNKKANLQEQIAQLSHLKEKLQASSCESEKMRVIQEKERLQEEVKRLTMKLEKSIENANGLYFEIIQQVDKMNVDVANGISEFRQLMTE
ncbi:hypothetical protein C0Q70_00702 [Pomacea canaliculata]|uniref:Kinetochore protein Nuf2 N-terminal domain-containing protein n=1 Tax=Pomacea canaliculata TaxID=400727 RepID=A0A2T7PXD1_POMCA|nr:hypothetical protein C0Q70_00702 [Pomacea canaliculata]